MKLESAPPAIEAVIRDATGNSFTVTTCTPVGGGCTHTAVSVTDGVARYFVKLGTADALPLFEAESDGLAAIRANGAFRTPTVVASGCVEGVAILVLEHLDIRPLSTDDEGCRFAAALVKLHREIGEHFGWHRDNFIGRTPQHNSETENWSRFFAEHRLKPQFELARRNGFDGELQQQGQRLIERLPALFLDYHAAPSLLHGDLWHGNAGLAPDGSPVVFDPAVHHGDRESEIAMCELFGGFPTAFHAEYRKAWPLNPDHEERKPLYSLYHVLNHLNLFGRSYLGEAQRLTAKLVRRLGR